MADTAEAEPASHPEEPQDAEPPVSGEGSDNHIAEDTADIPSDSDTPATPKTQPPRNPDPFPEELEPEHQPEPEPTVTEVAPVDPPQEHESPPVTAADAPPADAPEPNTEKAPPIDTNGHTDATVAGEHAAPQAQAETVTAESEAPQTETAGEPVEAAAPAEAATEAEPMAETTVEPIREATAEAAPAEPIAASEVEEVAAEVEAAAVARESIAEAAVGAETGSGEPIPEAAAAAEGATEIDSLARELLEEAAKPSVPPPSYVEPPEPLEPVSEVEAITLAEERLMAVNYDWDQTEKSVIIRVSLPDNVVTKNLAVTIKKDRLTVTILGKPFVEWRLFGAVEVVDDEAQWTVTTAKGSSKKVLEFDLTKEDVEMWRYLIKQRLPPALLLPQEEIQRLVDEDLKDLQPKDGSVPGVVIGRDGIKLNPEVEELRAPEQGLTGAQLYQNGITCFRKGSKEFMEGQRLLRLSALHHDHTDACLFLYEVYTDDTNYGVPKDVQAGLWFLRLAVDKAQDMRALSTLASQYEHGLLGLPQSFGLAVKYFQRAARQGHATAMSHLGDLLLQGRCINVRAEPQEARRRPEVGRALLLHAQQRGCPQAYVTLGDCYLRELPGFERDVIKAEACYEVAKRLFPDLRAVIPTGELQLLKRAMEEARNPRPEPKPEPRQESEEIPEISTALGKPKPQEKDKALQDRIRRLDGQLTKTTSQPSEPPVVTVDRLWFSAGFWENVGTIAAAVALGAWLIYVQRPPASIGRR